MPARSQPAASWLAGVMILMDRARRPRAVPFSALSPGERHSCALGQDGKLVCWGEADGGRSQAPYGVFTSPASYANHNCALRSGPMLTCWGVNESGEAPHIGISELVSGEIPALHYFEHGFFPADGLKPYQGQVTAGSLPPGIHLGVSLSPAGVVLFGTPSLPGVYPFSLSWQDAADIPLWLEQPYTLTVTGADLGVKIIPAHPQTALYSTPFSFQYVFTNATVLDAPQVQLSIKLPQGLSGITHSGIPGCLLSGLDLDCHHRSTGRRSQPDADRHRCGERPSRNVADHYGGHPVRVRRTGRRSLQAIIMTR